MNYTPYKKLLYELPFLCEIGNGVEVSFQKISVLARTVQKSIGRDRCFDQFEPFRGGPRH